MSELKINQAMMRAHLEFLHSGLNDYDDGRFEIGSLTGATTNNYPLHDIDSAINAAVMLNNAGNNVYTLPALVDPEIMPAGRASDEHVYALNALWVDIDDEHDKEALKRLYDHLPAVSRCYNSNS